MQSTAWKTIEFWKWRTNSDNEGIQKGNLFFLWNQPNLCELPDCIYPFKVSSLIRQLLTEGKQSNISKAFLVPAFQILTFQNQCQDKNLAKRALLNQHNLTKVSGETITKTQKVDHWWKELPRSHQETARSETSMRLTWKFVCTEYNWLEGRHNGMTGVRDVTYLSSIGSWVSKSHLRQGRVYWMRRARSVTKEYTKPS